MTYGIGKPLSPPITQTPTAKQQPGQQGEVLKFGSSNVLGEIAWVRTPAAQQAITELLHQHGEVGATTLKELYLQSGKPLTQRDIQDASEKLKQLKQKNDQANRKLIRRLTRDQGDGSKSQDADETNDNQEPDIFKQLLIKVAQQHGMRPETLFTANVMNDLKNKIHQAIEAASEFNYLPVPFATGYHIAENIIANYIVNMQSLEK